MDSTNGRIDPDTARMFRDHNNARLTCCCGRPDCAYLEHNDTALGGLERDLETAARLGQALLSRHESYITESQAEHARLSKHITELESERVSLQSANEKIVAENRDLLSQLEALNTNLASSDEDVRRLEDLLLSCELEVKRLNGLVRKNTELDERLQAMEEERLAMSKQIDEGRDDTRNTLSRWRESERRVRELEAEVQRIEHEARMDRVKHEEIVARMESERRLERELGGAEGRLKGAAARQNLKNENAGSKNVVSHFVRDILQDNANLQAGIEELRELLRSSNEEVQNLREQVILHQPIGNHEDGEDTHALVSLEEQLAQHQPSPKQVQQEVHVHHHYHAKLAKKEKPVSARRPSRRRTVMPAHSSSDVSNPPTPMSRPQRYSSSPIIPMSLYHPQPLTNNRWSMQSTATGSSMLSSIPSSPRSYFDRGGSIFDRIEQGEESSRPTSPESVGDFVSSAWRHKPTKASESGLGIFEEETDDEVPELLPAIKDEEFSTDDMPSETRKEPEVVPEQELTPKPSLVLQSTTPKVQESIRLKPEPRPPDGNKQPRFGSYDHTSEFADPPRQATETRHSLLRSSSHESLVSISGMDIHIAKRPSPTSTLELLRGNFAHFAHPPSQARKISGPQPLASVTEYTAVSTTRFEDTTASPQTVRRMPSGIEALSGIAVPPPRNQKQANQASAGLGRLVGGWVRGRWSVAPTKSVADLRSVSVGGDDPPPSIHSLPTSDETSVHSMPSAVSDESTRSPDYFSGPTKTNPTFPQRSIVDSNPLNANVDLATLFAGRLPGINQPGSIPGFRAAMMSKRTPSEVQAKVIDEEGLRESLAE